jgi:hypothetical protein
VPRSSAIKRVVGRTLRAPGVGAKCKGGRELFSKEVTMLKEKLKEVIVSELKRQAANSPRLLHVDDSKELVVVKGKINFDERVVVIAGALAGGP